MVFLFCLVLWVVWWGFLFNWLFPGFFSVVGVFFLQFSIYRAHRLQIPVLQTSVSGIEMAVRGKVRKGCANHSSKDCQKCSTAEEQCTNLQVPCGRWL